MAPLPFFSSPPPSRGLRECDVHGEPARGGQAAVSEHEPGDIGSGNSSSSEEDEEEEEKQEQEEEKEES